MLVTSMRWWVLCGPLVTFVGAADAFKYAPVNRHLNEVITTAGCTQMGTMDAYPARLDLVYVYSLEFHDTLVDLLGIERAIATSVASTLTTCGVNSQPVYAVELSDFSAHRVLESKDSVLCGNRSSTVWEDTQCRIVRGVTSIRVENGGNTGISVPILRLIEATLEDTLFLQQYSSLNVTRAKFDRSIGGNLVLEASDETTNTAPNEHDPDKDNRFTVVAALIVALVVVALCVLGIYHHSRSEESSQVIKERLARVQAKRRQYFQNLEDPSVSSGWMPTDAPATHLYPPPQTTTWSDITSDSESIISVLPMDRIEEEVTDGSETDGEEVEVSLSGTAALPGIPDCTPMNLDHLTFIAHWNVLSGGAGDSDMASYTDVEQATEQSPPLDVTQEIELDAGGDPFWLDQETPVRSNRGSLDEHTPSNSSVRSQVLHGCEFVFEHTEPPVSWLTDPRDDVSSNSSQLDVSSDEFDADEEIARDNPKLTRPTGPKVKPLCDRTNSSSSGILSDVESSVSSSTTDPQLTQWARGVLDQITTGSVKLLNCGIEGEKR